MPASLKDVAKQANVSLSTASLALNGKPVKEETRRRVIEAAEKLHYYANVNGRNLSTNKTHNIVLAVLNDSAKHDYTEQISYYYHLLKGVMDYAQKKNYSVRFEVVSWDKLYEEDYFEKIVYGHSADGIIVIPQYKYNTNFIQLFEKEEFPFVVINPWVDVSPEHKVIVDNFMGGHMAADYINIKKYDKIFMIGGPRDHINASAIEKGFLAGLLRAGKTFDISNIIYSDYTFEGGAWAMEQLINKHDIKGSVIFSANDYMATGAMSVLKAKGFEIPKDVAIIGFDGAEISRCVYPRLTTFFVDTRAIGESAVKRLLGMVENDPNRKFYREIQFVPGLTEGGTM